MPEQNHVKTMDTEPTYNEMPPLKMSMGAFEYMDLIEKRAQEKIVRAEKKYQVMIDHLENTLDSKNLVIKECKHLLIHSKTAFIAKIDRN